MKRKILYRFYCIIHLLLDVGLILFLIINRNRIFIWKSEESSSIILFLVLCLIYAGCVLLLGFVALVMISEILETPDELEKSTTLSAYQIFYKKQKSYSQA